MSKLMEKYENEVRKALAEALDIKNVMAVPKITKIVVNSGIGDLLKNKEGTEKFLNDLGAITGQKPAIRNAKISVSGFNVRAGQPVGVTVVLRGKRMYDFLEKLISIVLPRLRDFRGVPVKSFDKSGNYTLGMAEHTVFPEVDMNKVDRPRGMEITIVSTAGNPEKARKLLELVGMPFEK